MSDERMLVVELRIHDLDGGGNNQSETAIDSEGKNNDNKKKKKNKALSALSSLGGYALSQTINSLEQTVDLSVNRYFNMSENYVAQTAYGNIKKGIGMVSSLTTSVMSGVTMGSAFGPVGMLIGGALSVGAWGLNQYQQYLDRMNSYYTALNETNFGTSWARQRAGLYDGGRGTEN